MIYSETEKDKTIELVYIDTRNSGFNLTYTGNNDEGSIKMTTRGKTYQSSVPSSRMRSMIGLVDITGRIQLMPSNVIELVEQKTLTDCNDENNASAREEISTSDRSRILIDSFGSAKQKRILHAKLANQINDESLDIAVTCAQDSIDSSVIDNIESTIQADREFFLDLLPKCNLDAKLPQDVYRLSDIVTEEELDLLNEEARSVCAMSTEQKEISFQTSQWTYYRSHILNRSLSDNKDSQRYCSMLIFHKYLMQLHQAGVRMINRKVPFLTDAPCKIRDRLFAEYVSKSSNDEKEKFPKKITARSKERLLNNILILALFIDNFAVNLTYFMKDLKLNRNRICHAAEAIGCHLRSVMERSGNQKSIQIATLRTPVKFQSLTNNQRRR
ncbi:hypothetical protein GJ496_010022 [Pomphorhynchus laevis]|nr:hypothetical protein GJ496_010022 [Pomphorhynchus laevis]